MTKLITSRQLAAAEITLIAATLLLAGFWYFDPRGNWEPILVVVAALTAIVDVFRRFGPKNLSDRFSSTAERLRHREHLRKILQDEIYTCRAKKLRQDVIIRDVSRADHYPEISDEEKGISPWFRVGLLDTYDKGIVLGLRYGGLKECPDGFRFVDYINEEEADITVLLAANVPYDSIAEVNLDGDEYYNFPHIYCHFDFDGEPYTRLWFAQRVDISETRPYFKLIAEYGDVTRNNPLDGPLHFY